MKKLLIVLAVIVSGAYLLVTSNQSAVRSTTAEIKEDNNDFFMTLSRKYSEQVGLPEGIGL
ncbi:MAG: hypothetical protein RBQ95_05495 [Paracholeplasma sp.]|nr:hypothetical protein [Paracholeplasma sp.]MDY3196297.1 hypothetical protein [Paracholeplasma sp.]